MDDAISLLAVENNESYSGYVESRLLMNDNIKKTIQELEKLPKFPKTNLEKFRANKRFKKLRERVAQRPNQSFQRQISRATD